MWSIGVPATEIQLETAGLTLADEKMEVVLMSNRRKNFVDSVGGHTVKPAIRCLGIMIAVKLSFREDLEYACQKA